LTDYNLTYNPYGKQAVLVKWPSQINENILIDILNFKKKILKERCKVILDVIVAYNSITIIYASLIENIYNEILILKSMYKERLSINIVKKILFILWVFCQVFCTSED